MLYFLFSRTNICKYILFNQKKKNARNRPLCMFNLSQNGDSVILTLSPNKLERYNIDMRNKIVIGLLSSISILMLIISVSLYNSINIILNADNRIINCGEYYILQTPEETYYQVCDENNMFDKEMITRISNFSSFENYKNVSFCELNSDESIISKLFLGINNSDEQITMYENNKKAVIFSRCNCNQYFVRENFSLPEMSADNIEAVVVSDSTDYKNILEKHTDYSDIKNILENNKDFFTEINNKYSDAYDCYIIYKDFDLVEFISSE